MSPGRSYSTYLCNGNTVGDVVGHSYDMMLYNLMARIDFYCFICHSASFLCRLFPFQLSVFSLSISST